MINYKNILLFLLIATTTGCAELRYGVGRYYGDKQYKQSKVTDPQKGFGAGYKDAWKENETADELELQEEKNERLRKKIKMEKDLDRRLNEKMKRNKRAGH